MKNMVRQAGKVLLKLLAVYLVFALVCNILPFALGIDIDPEAARTLGQVEFYGEGEGVDRVTLLESPAHALGARLMVLQAAERSVDIAYHIIQAGDSTDAVLAQLIAAADRGVAVRVLLDGTAGMVDAETRRSMADLATHENISYRTYSPVNLLVPWEWQAVLHDKFIAVDGRWLILGGRNLGDRFYGPEGYDGKLTNDRDVLVWRTGEQEEDGSVLHQVDRYMNSLWDNAYGKERGGGEKAAQERMADIQSRAAVFEAANPVFYQLTLEDYWERTVATNRVTLIHNPIHTKKKEPWAAFQMQRLALEARHSVLVQTPYATANASLLRTMEAVGETADVVMVTNSMASSPNYPAFSNYHSRRDRFARTGARIYEYQSEDSIHGKSMVVDGRISVVGSLNMDDRSFYIDTESMLIIDSQPFSQILEAAIGEIQARCLLVDEEGKGYAPGQALEPIEVSLGKRAGMAVASWFSRPLQFLM